MTRYRRNRLAGGCYFFTVNLAERRRHLLTAHVDALRRAFRHVRSRHPFAIEAVVVLPDHLHAIWTLPDGDADFAQRWRLIKAAFARGQPAGERISASRAAKGERGIWQRRYWEHTIRYIHYNPVKHALVRNVQNWPWSSFHRMVRLGSYPADWGGGVEDDGGGFGER